MLNFSNKGFLKLFTELNALRMKDTVSGVFVNVKGFCEERPLLVFLFGFLVGLYALESNVFSIENPMVETVEKPVLNEIPAAQEAEEVPYDESEEWLLKLLSASCLVGVTIVI